MALLATHKHTILASMVLLLSCHTSLSLADNGGYYPQPTYNQAPQGYGSGGYPPQNYGNNQGYNMPWNNNGSGNNMPWGNNGYGNNNYGNNGWGNNMPWNNNSGGSNGPWNSGPWNNGGWGNGGQNPFGPRNPSQWFNPNKQNMSNNWDDMLNAPSRMGRMPGGWRAPSVSVPNPIDVGEEFGDAARDMPDQMNNFNN